MGCGRLWWDIIGCMVGYGWLWWFLVSCAGLYLVVVGYGRLLLVVMFYGGFLVGSWWIMVGYGEFWRVINCRLWWVMVDYGRL